MKLWQSTDPQFRKKNRVLNGCVLALVLIYAAVSVVLAVITRDQWLGGWIVLVFMALLAGVLTPILWAFVRFIRWRMTVRHGVEVPDNALDKGLSITAFVSGAVALILFLLISFGDVDLRYPWEDLGLEAFMIVALCVSLSALLFNLAAQTILRWAEEKVDETKMMAVTKGLRRIAAAVVGLVLLGGLLIPFDHGTYNDGGSEFYKATLYEVILWDRKPAEGAMALPEDFDPEEEQKTRIYVFPFHGYTFNAKWDMKH